MAKRAARRKGPTKRASTARTTTARPKAKRGGGRSTAARRKTNRRASAARTTRAKPTPKPSRTSTAATLVRGFAEGTIAAITDRLPWAKNENDPIRLLETDHRRFEELLERGEKTTDGAAKARRELLAILTAELNVHEVIEERILYPALRSHPEAKDIVLEGYQEHHVADLIVNELHEVATHDERWGAKFKVLKESLEHHIQEEERLMFPTARGIFDRQQLNALGRRMRKLKEELEGTP